ncbi:MAG: GNAT family N-acetyltransferase [Planctomycetales bacterium]|nr:GNAT family N-acetyltransferase [Planctomycetales bacterium]
MPVNTTIDLSRSVKQPELNATFSTTGTSYRCLNWLATTPEFRSELTSIRSSRSAYRSPFFSPEFITAVDSIAGDVELGLVEQNGQVLAWLPFQRRSKIGRPVGGGINDAHGVISAPDVEFSIYELLKACGLQAYPFHAAPPFESVHRQFELGRSNSFLADLTVDPSGYEAYLRKTSTTIDRQGQKTRRLVRELGALHFEFDCRDELMMHKLIDLKRSQYQETHTFDIFSVSWIRQLLFHLWHSQASTRGILSVLYAGTAPLALHFGIIEGNWLHYWFPVYDPAFAHGSPGTQLFLDVAREATERGYVAIDMGYGEQLYKRKLTNVVTEMSWGMISPEAWRRSLHKTQVNWSRHMKGTWLRNNLKPLARRIMPNWGGECYKQ